MKIRPEIDNYVETQFFYSVSEWKEKVKMPYIL